MGSKAFLMLMITTLVIGGAIGSAIAMATNQGKGNNVRANTSSVNTTGDTGTKAASTTSTTPTPTLAGPTSTAGGNGGRGQFGQNRLIGTLAEIDGNDIMVETSQGRVSVIANASTSVQKTVTGNIGDLKAGIQVSITGQRGPDGMIQAQNVIVLAQGVGGLFGQGDSANGGGLGGQNGGQGSGRQGGGAEGAGSAGNGQTGPGAVVGTIDSIEGGVVTVKTTQGIMLKASVGADVPVQQTIAGGLQDLKIGLRLSIVGQRDANGVVQAQTILIDPEGAGGFFGQGGRQFQPPSTPQQ